VPIYEPVDDEVEEYDPNLQAPDGDYWCRFGKGLECMNGEKCRNPNHRKEDDGGEQQR
jgi:hypothetical protein